VRLSESHASGRAAQAISAVFVDYLIAALHEIERAIRAGGQWPDLLLLADIFDVLDLPITSGNSGRPSWWTSDSDTRS